MKLSLKFLVRCSEKAIVLFLRSIFEVDDENALFMTFDDKIWCMTSRYSW